MKNVKKTTKKPDHDIIERRNCNCYFLNQNKNMRTVKSKMVSIENQNITVTYCVGKVGESEPNF